MPVENWMYNDMRQIGTDYSSDEEIRKYDERMSKFRNIDHEIEDILQHIDINKNHTIIEIGCGTGETSIAIASLCQKVIAVDVSSQMLEYANKKAQSRNIGNISFVNAGFLRFSCEEKVDAVISQIALHHIPDFWKMIALKKIYNAMKDKGRLYLRDVVFSFDMEKYINTIEYYIQDIEKNAGHDTARNFENHIKNEYSTFDWIMEEMLYRAGFYIDDADYKEYIARYVCTKVKQ